MNAYEARSIEKIRTQYSAHERTKFDELRALDKKVKRPVTVLAYLLGIIGSLVLGTGMCLAMEVIGDRMLLGIGIGLVGIALVSITYPIYKSMLKSRKKKYSQKIFELSDSILNQ